MGVDPVVTEVLEAAMGIKEPAARLLDQLPHLPAVPQVCGLPLQAPVSQLARILALLLLVLTRAVAVVAPVRAQGVTRTTILAQRKTD